MSYTPKFPTSLWEDLRFPASLIRQGATTKPDFDTTNIGLLFPQNDDAEIAYLIAQLPHAYLLESDLHCHIHWVQTGATFPTWKIDYRWYENDSDPTGGFTTLPVNTGKFSYSSGSLMQISEFSEISGSGKNTISSILEVKLYRDDNDVAGDILLKEFDIHYQLDQPGSGQEYVK
jgi:hypothetical protein